MKNVCWCLLWLVASQVQAQIQDVLRYEQEVRADYELAKTEFLEGQYERFTQFYESKVLNKRPVILEGYKMAGLSYQALAVGHADSLYLSEKAQQVLQEAIRHYGQGMINEYWDTFEVGVSDPNPVYDIVEKQPAFPGGIQAFYDEIAAEVQYPQQAWDEGIEGNVFVQFIVNKDGSIDAVQVVKGIGAGCDAEVVRVMKQAPDFMPGIQRGEPVYVRMMFPVIFKIPRKELKRRKKAARG